MLKAVLFDFDGVIADTEPLHYALFQKVLKEEGLTLSKADYAEKYLGYDDEECFAHVYQDQRQHLSLHKKKDLMARKSKYFQKEIAKKSYLMPGAKRVITTLAKRMPLGVVSGALRPEIENVLKKEKLDKYFQFVIGAEDVRKGKPHPAGYQQGFKRMQELVDGIQKQECLVIEDSQWGIEAAQKAGLPCLAVAHSYDDDKLDDADAIVKSIKDITVKYLDELADEL